MTKDLTKKKNTELATSDIYSALEEVSGEGISYEVSVRDIPLIKIAQTVSDELKPNNPKYIKGLAVGNYFNTITNEYFDGADPLQVIVCYQTTKYQEWLEETKRTPDTNPFVGECEPTDPRVVMAESERAKFQSNRAVFENGNELVIKDVHYCLIVDDQGSKGFCAIEMKNTSKKVSDRWKTSQAMYTATNPATGKRFIPPIYGCVWDLSVVEETNKKQQSYYIWKVSNARLVEQFNLIDEAKNYRKLVASGDTNIVGGDENINDTDVPQKPKTSGAKNEPF